MSRDFTATVVATAGGTTYSPVYVPDFNQNNFQVSMFLTGFSGSAAATIQHTISDPFSQNLNVASNGSWNNHEFLTAISSADDGNYAFPVKGIRLALAAAASATATLTLIQGESTGG